MAIKKPRTGQRVWVCIESQIHEVKLEDGSIDGFWEKGGKFCIGMDLYHTEDYSIFTSLNALLDDLRSRAIHLKD